MSGKIKIIDFNECHNWRMKEEADAVCAIDIACLS